MQGRPEMRTIDTARAKEYHQRREAKRRQRSEALRQHWLQTVQTAGAALAPRFPAIKGVYLFGSLPRQRSTCDR